MPIPIYFYVVKSLISFLQFEEHGVDMLIGNDFISKHFPLIVDDENVYLKINGVLSLFLQKLMQKKRFRKYIDARLKGHKRFKKELIPSQRNISNSKSHWKG